MRSACPASPRMDTAPDARRNLPPERADAELQPCETIACSHPRLRRTEQNTALLLLSWVPRQPGAPIFGVTARLTLGATGTELSVCSRADGKTAARDRSSTSLGEAVRGSKVRAHGHQPSLTCHSPPPPARRPATFAPPTATPTPLASSSPRTPSRQACFACAHAAHHIPSHSSKRPCLTPVAHLA